MKILTLALVLTYCLVGCGRNADSLSIKDTFEAYKTAILNDDGQAAYGLVDARTREWYRLTLERALKWDRNQIMKLGVIDKIQVILIRHRIPKESLLKMTPGTLFQYAVDQGWVGKDSVSNLSIGQVDATADFASAVARSKGRDTPMRLHFYKENGGWRIDLTQLTKWGEPAFASRIEQSGLSETEFIFRVVSAVSGKPVQDDIWNPLVPAP